MKKTLFLTIMAIALFGMINFVFAHGGVPDENAMVYFYDATNRDLIISPDDFPTYFLLNLKDSSCPAFTNGERIYAHLDNNYPSRIFRVNTNEECFGQHGIAEIQGGFNKLTSVDSQANILNFMDEDHNLFEIHYGAGCENASNYVHQGIYLGTGWQNGELFLPGGSGQCHIMSLNQIN